MTEDLTTFFAEKKKQGLTDEEAMALANLKFGGGDSPVAAVATPGSGEALGPDPALVRRYQQMLKTYVPPKTQFSVAEIKADDPEIRAVVMEAINDGHRTLDRAKKEALADAIMAKLQGFGGVKVPKQFYDWVRQWQAWETVRRKMGDMMPDNQVLGLMIREHWHAHPMERAQLQSMKVGSAKTGPAMAFDRATDSWKM